MSRRLWYSQLDAYDAIRRLASLLAIWPTNTAPSLERLYICDFYLATPPLLYQARMPQEVRSEFSKLGIHRPEKAFISYPSSPLLFQKMEEVQRQAFRTLTAKGLINLTFLKTGTVVPTASGLRLFKDRFLPLMNPSELKIAEFLSTSFASRQGQSIEELRQGTGLRRASV